MPEPTDLSLPSTRKEALRVRSTRYFTGLACVHGHMSDRYTATGGCCECVNKRTLISEHRIRKAARDLGIPLKEYRNRRAVKAPRSDSLRSWLLSC